ncbi:MAG: hypothetical protein ACPGXK_00430 [Phycisphaerae bacterium]
MVKPKTTQFVLFLALPVIALMSAPIFAQGPFPIAEPAEDPLTPSGITELDISLDGEFAYLFDLEDGTKVAHFLGGFQLRQGEGPVYELGAKEAVVWISEGLYEGTVYRHLDILLWRDATISEPGGTTTEGPALFVTLNSAGDLALNADQLAFESSEESKVYRNGNKLRMALADADVLIDNVDSPLQVLDTTGLTLQRPRPKIKPPVVFQAPGELQTVSVDGRDVITVVGGAYLSRGDPRADRFLEIRAESVAVYLPQRDQNKEDTDRNARSPRRDRQMMAGSFGQQEVEGVYLEGDVRMQQGPVSVRADRVYYDFNLERALIVDTVMYSSIQGRNVPLYVRASEVRQLSPEEFIANDAMVSTSEFHTPHYHLGAKEVYLINQTPLEPTGERSSIQAGAFEIKEATLNINNTPFFWIPYSKGKIDNSESALRRLRVGYSDDFGAELESSWELFTSLGLETPEGFDGLLRRDAYTERGVGLGADVFYERDDYFGQLRSYIMYDGGEDNLGRQRREQDYSGIRGRLLLRHRQYLEDDWQISLELSYLSDVQFLEEFFEREFDNDKEQETLVYLKKQRDNWAFTIGAQTRILDFTTQTERFPDMGLFLVGEPLGDVATLYSENRAGLVRYRFAEQDLFQSLRLGSGDSSGTVLRVDTRQEIDTPIDLGDLRIVPFASVRGTAYDDTPEDGAVQRVFGTAGIRGSTYAWKQYPDAASELWDIDGMRHIIKTDFTGWVAGTNYDAQSLHPFDSTVGGEVVESIDGTSGFELGIRQRWQTKRGQGENRRVVDFLTLDIEAGFFDDATNRRFTNGFASFSRPENSIARNYVNTSSVWRINDRTALLHEMNFDINDAEIDLLNVSIAVERTPRFSYLLGYRYIGETNSNLLAFDLNYKLSEKHSIALRELFDLSTGRTLDFTVGFVRKFPRWYGAISFELDDTEDDFGVSFSIWPEGLPNVTLGSRRFTGLATSTRIQN